MSPIQQELGILGVLRGYLATLQGLPEHLVGSNFRYLQHLIRQNREKYAEMPDLALYATFEAIKPVGIGGVSVATYELAKIDHPACLDLDLRLPVTLPDFAAFLQENEEFRKQFGDSLKNSKYGWIIPWMDGQGLEYSLPVNSVLVKKLPQGQHGYSSILSARLRVDGEGSDHERALVNALVDALFPNWSAGSFSITDSKIPLNLD